MKISHSPTSVLSLSSHLLAQIHAAAVWHWSLCPKYLQAPNPYPIFHVSTLCVCLPSSQARLWLVLVGTVQVSTGRRGHLGFRGETLVSLPGLPAWSDGPGRVGVSSGAIVYTLRSLQLRGTVVISSVHMESRSWQDTFSEMWPNWGRKRGVSSELRGGGEPLMR